MGGLLRARAYLRPAAFQANAIVMVGRVVWCGWRVMVDCEVQCWVSWRLSVGNFSAGADLMIT